MKLSIDKTFLIKTTIQGRKLLISRTYLVRQVFKGDNYSRKETIYGKTVLEIKDFKKKSIENQLLWKWKTNNLSFLRYFV